MSQDQTTDGLASDPILDRALYIGVDPGVSGGIAALYDTGQYAWAKKMPATEGDIFEVFNGVVMWCRDNVYRPKACIEMVHAMPAQGVRSVFTFGRNYGFLRACLYGARIPFEEITPQAWQGALRCRTKGDKNVTKKKAQQLWPDRGRGITHAIADALLIAEWYRRQDLGRN